MSPRKKACQVFIERPPPIDGWRLANMALQQVTLIRAKYDGENEVTDFFSLGKP
jgi:hypothetical protein